MGVQEEIYDCRSALLISAAPLPQRLSVVRIGMTIGATSSLATVSRCLQAVVREPTTSKPLCISKAPSTTASCRNVCHITYRQPPGIPTRFGPVTLVRFLRSPFNISGADYAQPDLKLQPTLTYPRLSQAIIPTQTMTNSDLHFLSSMLPT